LADLVPTTRGKWITHPPTRCLKTRSAQAKSSSATKRVPGMAVGTRTGPAASRRNCLHASVFRSM